MGMQNDGTDNNSVPATGDSGLTYGAGILDLLKTGIGAYEAITISNNQFETKARYDALNGDLYMNGQKATPLLSTATSSSLMPLLLIGGLVVVAVLMIK